MLDGTSYAVRRFPKYEPGSYGAALSGEGRRRRAASPPATVELCSYVIRRMLIATRARLRTSTRASLPPASIARGRPTHGLGARERERPEAFAAKQLEAMPAVARDDRRKRRGRVVIVCEGRRRQRQIARRTAWRAVGR